MGRREGCPREHPKCAPTRRCLCAWGTAVETTAMHAVGRSWGWGGETPRGLWAPSATPRPVLGPVLLCLVSWVP